MKTTLDLPEDLMREIKIRAAKEDKKLKDLVAELLRCGLAEQRPDKIRNRVQFPLVRTAHPAAPGEELTPEVIAQILIDQEVDWALGKE